MSHKSSSAPKIDKAFRRYQKTRSEFWDRAAGTAETAGSRYYHRHLTKVYRFLVRPGLKVLELGCGAGDLLAALEPERGVGVDFSPAMIETAKSRHPDLSFIETDVHHLQLDEKFDVIVISDLANDVWDVQKLLDTVAQLSHPGTRVILNTFNRLWQIPIRVVRSTGLAMPLLKQNWLSLGDMRNLLRLSGFEVISTQGEILWPLRTPLIGGFLNRFLVRLWPFTHLALTHFIVARTDPFRFGSSMNGEASVSVIVPARNEAGHIEEIVERVPVMGSRTEVLFVEGNSTDDTLQVIKEIVAKQANPDIRYYVQPGVGKGDAVRHGYDHATGEVLMILDADMTVATRGPPSVLPGHRQRNRGIHQRSTACLSDGGPGHAIPQLPGKQVLRRHIQLAAETAGQRHFVRHQGPQSKGI